LTIERHISAATLKTYLLEGGTSVGSWCTIPSPFVVEIMASHFDWLCIDVQHGLAGQSEMVTMLQSAAIRDTPTLVRVPWNSPYEIMRALDAGAEGVIVPMVNSVEEAREAVGACRYPPAGHRSWGPTRNALYKGHLTPAEIDETVLCAVMIETVAALEQLDEILQVEGIDAVFVGAVDLAISMGLPPAVGDRKSVV